MVYCGGCRPVGGNDEEHMKVLIYHKQMTAFLAGGMFQPLMFIAELQKTCSVTLALNGGADIRKVVEMAGVPPGPGTRWSIRW